MPESMLSYTLAVHQRIDQQSGGVRLFGPDGKHIINTFCQFSRKQGRAEIEFRLINLGLHNLQLHLAPDATRFLGMDCHVLLQLPASTVAAYVESKCKAIAHGVWDSRAHVLAAYTRIVLTKLTGYDVDIVSRELAAELTDDTAALAAYKQAQERKA